MVFEKPLRQTTKSPIINHKVAEKAGVSKGAERLPLSLHSKRMAAVIQKQRSEMESTHFHNNEGNI